MSKPDRKILVLPDIHAPQVEILFRRSTIRAGRGCWEWNGSLTHDGYGRVSKGKGQILAHRASYSYFFGDPGDAFVCHECDNPKCWNPEHLWLGTAKDNMDDKHAKGRAVYERGSGHHHAKLNEDIVWNIRFGEFKGQSDAVLAARFGVVRSVITNIRLGVRWKHVTEHRV